MNILIISILLIGIIQSAIQIRRKPCPDCDKGRLSALYFDGKFDKYIIECDKCQRLYCLYELEK